MHKIKMSFVGGVITGGPDPRSRSFNLLIASPLPSNQVQQVQQSPEKLARSVIKMEMPGHTKLSPGAQAFSIQ